MIIALPSFAALAARLCLFALLLGSGAAARAQATPPAVPAIPGIAEFTAQMQRESGFLPFFADAQAGRLYLLLPDSPRELLYQVSLPRGLGSNDIGLDRGQPGRGGAALVRLEPAGDKVLLRRLNTRFRAESADAAERRAAEEAFASAVLWGFPVVARGDGELLVDATAFLLRDAHGVAPRLAAQEQGQFSVDDTRSALYLPRSRAFPRNTELEAVVTFTGSEAGDYLRQVSPDERAFTVHMHHSFVALPEPGYRPRPFHPESGFWPVSYADYATAITEALVRRVIPRHRLQTRRADDGSRRVVDPIVYYLDPGVPEPVRSALLDGARWWEEAFAAAGFPGGFRVKLLPRDADPMDLRYNVIQWVHRATRGWSYGSSIIDPRSGEIIKGQVTLGSLRVRQDLLIARGMTSPFADHEAAGEDAGDALTSAMALARIRQLAAHEVGHTLGLAHNFAASVRDRASVMDYPYLRLTLGDDGRVHLDDAYDSGIGAWDLRTIRYGYAELPEEEEAEALAALLAANRADGFEFISDPDSREARDFHPRSHLWDNGGDAVAELERLLALREAALARFGADSIPVGAAFSDLQEALVPVYLFHRYQVEAAGKLVGGADYRYPRRGELADGERPLRAVPPARQRAALAALLRTLEPQRLALPPDLLAQIPPKAYGHRRGRESPPARTGALFDPLSLAEGAAGHTLQVLLHPERLARLDLQHSLDAGQLSARELFRRLHGALLEPEYAGLEGAVDRRTAGLLLTHWRAIAADAALAPALRAAALAALEDAARLLQRRAEDGEGPYADFYAFEVRLIEQALQPPQGLPESQPVAAPPGSPIGG